MQSLNVGEKRNQKLLKHLCSLRKILRILILHVFWFYCRVGHGMHWHCSFHFHYVEDKIMLTLEVNSPEESVIHLFAILWVFLVGSVN